MPTIDHTYFFAELSIAQKADVANSLLMFINEHEERLLTDLLGYELYKAYKTGIAEPTPAAKWTEIRDGAEYTSRSGYLTKWKGLILIYGSGAVKSKKSLIANYVYWHWMSNNQTVSTGSGEKAAANQAAEFVPVAPKMIRAWNQMVDWNRMLIDYIVSKWDTYPEFHNYYGRLPEELFKKQNLFGI